jgi:hypothetical protein
MWSCALLPVFLGYYMEFAYRFSDSDLTQYVKDRAASFHLPVLLGYIELMYTSIDLTHCFNAWFQWWTILPTLLSTKRIPRWALSSQRWWPSSVGPSDGCVAVRFCEQQAKVRWIVNRCFLFVHLRVHLACDEEHEWTFFFCASGGALSMWWKNTKRLDRDVCRKLLSNANLLMGIFTHYSQFTDALTMVACTCVLCASLPAC